MRIKRVPLSGKRKPTDESAARAMERQIEAAIIEIIGRHGFRKFTLLPSHATVKLMAKAAAAVYAAATENYRPREAQLLT